MAGRQAARRGRLDGSGHGHRRLGVGAGASGSWPPVPAGTLPDGAAHRRHIFEPLGNRQRLGQRVAIVRPGNEASFCQEGQFGRFEAPADGRTYRWAGSGKWSNRRAGISV